MDELLCLAKQIEELSLNPEGYVVDGSPYRCRAEATDFLRRAYPELGGIKKIQELIRKRKANEPLADPNCANWVLWTILNELGVSRARE